MTNANASQRRALIRTLGPKWCTETLKQIMRKMRALTANLSDKQMLLLPKENKEIPAFFVEGSCGKL